MNPLAFTTVALATRPAAADGKQWVHYLPSGEFVGRDGRGPWRLDDPEGFAEASFRYSGGAAIPVDFDHALEVAATARTPAPAAGWIDQLEPRPDGMWGRTEWTTRAAEHIAGREYRFVSPVFFHTKDGAATALKAAALTNQPALNLTAICTMEAAHVAKDLEQLCRELRPMLGLTEAAEPDAILEAVRGLQTRAVAASTAPSPDKFVPIAQFETVVAAFNAQNRGVSTEAATMIVEREVEAGRLMPSLKGWALTLCAANKPAFEDFIRKTAGGSQALLTQTFSPRGAPSQDRLSDIDREIAARMGLSPEDFK